MTINEYQKLAQRTANTKLPSDKLENACLGLAGECGEVCDVLKKSLFQGHALDREHMIEELGDCAWYLAEAASGLGVSLEDILIQNIAKLKRRYPAGFDPERSMNRAEMDAGQEDEKMLEYKTVSMCGSSDYCRGWNDAVKEMPKWISVKEKMPSKGEKVLLYIPEREGCKQHGMYLGEAGEVEADPKGKNNFWLRPVYGSDWRISGWSYFEEPIVTHWMPLPDAPEVDDE